MSRRFAIFDSACSDFRKAQRLTRRDLLRAGSLSMFGLGLPSLLAGEAAARASGGPPSFGKAKACIVLFMWGG
ncbi:MAG TPA: hypothetical protein VFA18_03605, partial [Gemmataceae bacterium]|nr:hypothetical protein [Gemmataceae bacterium]